MPPIVIVAATEAFFAKPDTDGFTACVVFTDVTGAFATVFALGATLLAMVAVPLGTEAPMLADGNLAEKAGGPATTAGAVTAGDVEMLSFCGDGAALGDSFRPDPPPGAVGVLGTLGVLGVFGGVGVSGGVGVFGCCATKPLTRANDHGDHKPMLSFTRTAIDPRSIGIVI